MSAGDTICWILVQREHADDPHPEDGAQVPPGAVFSTRDEADAAAAESTADLIVAELVDRRPS